jgi:hypothetical protein
MDYSYALMDRTVYGRQEAWPQHAGTRTNGGAPDWPLISEWPGGRHRPVAPARSGALREPTAG